MHSNVILVLYLCFICLASAKPTERETEVKDWWEHAVFYQIYPRSFKDDNNDGVGDLKGIISKLPHLKDAGITAAWMSPIYSSPQVDAGYDISNYTDIHYEYGTIEDFDELLSEAHELGIKIIMDFVPNHSSNEHEWFIKSENREEGYEDYYVWAGGVDGGPPNNWLSQFKYSAWEYSEIRGQYYLHQFAVAQPDLNYRNPAVVQEMKDVMTFWLDRGVDGFRVDAIKYMFEDIEMRDELLTNDPNANEYEPGYLTNIYTTDQPETFDMVYQWREHVDKYTEEHGGDTRVFMTEVYSDIKNTMKYYGDGDRKGAHFTFNFELITELNANSNARDIVMAIKKWLTYMPYQYVPNWVIGNHDQNRTATRLGVENVDGFNMLVSVLPGVAVTYNGEEIGMENGDVTFEQGQDPSACNGSPDDFSSTTRDFARTPFHWDDSENAGFNLGAETWLPVSSKYVETNLAQQSQDGVWSHFKVYQALTSLRKESSALKNGKLDIQPYSDTVIGLTRQNEDETVVFLFNIGDESEEVNLSDLFDLNVELTVVIPSTSSEREIGDVIETASITLEPHESIVLI